MGRRVSHPAPGVIKLVRPGRVESPEVTVNPRQGGGNHHPEPTHGEESGGSNEEDCCGRNPYRARDEEYWREEDEAEDGSCDGYAGEDEENTAGDD